MNDLLLHGFLTEMWDYLSSEEGKKDYAEWTTQRQLNNKNQNGESH